MPNLDPLETMRICDAATPGEWVVKQGAGGAWYINAFNNLVNVYSGCIARVWHCKDVAANAAFIAHARTALPLYAAELQAARERLARAHAAVETAIACADVEGSGGQGFRWRELAEILGHE